MPRVPQSPLSRWITTIGAGALIVALAGCGGAPASESADPASQRATTQSEPLAESTPVAEEPPGQVQEETCDWDSPKLTAPVVVPEGQDGALREVLVGAWQHTHTDEGSGFEEVVNDHRYVFPAAERMLYCQHVPGATEYAENAADVVLNDTTIELPGGQYGYTVTAWDVDTLVWDNPVGGGYVYLLQRRDG